MITRKFFGLLFPDYSFRKTSYSQCGEDLIIRVIFSSVLKKYRPTYLDIGAYHPFKFSNTYLFYKFGSRGINIEPNPTSFESLRKYRSKDVNLNIGVGEKSAVMDYYRMASSALNTFSPSEAQRMNTEEGIKILGTLQVQVKTISEVLEESGFNEFPDFLSLDVEGNDLDLLQTINYQESSPNVICVETVQFSQGTNAKKNLNIISFLEQNGYYHYADTMINSIFVKRALIEDKFLELS